MEDHAPDTPFQSFCPRVLDFLPQVGLIEQVEFLMLP
jgi:hypothetical protein